MDSSELVSGEGARCGKLGALWAFSLAMAGAGIVGGIAVIESPLRTVCVSHCDKAPRDIASICAAIDSFMSANDGHAPDSLDVLVTPDPAGETYLKGRTVIPLDPWSNPYFYEPPMGGHSYRVYCLGHDGQPGGVGSDADIDNWTISAAKR